MKDDFFIDHWRVEPRRLVLSNDRQSVTIKPRSMAVLVELARANGEVVSRGDLITRVWGAADVSDDALTPVLGSQFVASGDAV